MASRIRTLAAFAALAALASGCTLVESTRTHFAGEEWDPDPNDPFEIENRQTHNFNDAVDRVFLKPTAEAYVNHAPEGVQSCISNFFSNLYEPVRIVSGLLVLDPLSASRSTTRFAANTVVGGLGCVDVAGEGMDVERQEIDLGLAARHWAGNEQSFYVVAPLFGPTTLIDGAGSAAASEFLNPIDATNPDVRDRDGDSPGAARYNPFGMRDQGHRQMTSGVQGLDARANLLVATDFVEEAALDPYSFIRDGYLDQRAAQAAALGPER